MNQMMNVMKMQQGVMIIAVYTKKREREMRKLLFPKR